MASVGKRIRHGAEATGFRLLTAVLRGLPRRRAMAIGAGLGHFAFDRGIRRDVAVHNVLEHLGARSTEEARAIARESYGVMGCTFTDLLRADLTTEDVAWKLMERSAFQPLAEVYAEGRGGVLVSGHIGNWELMVIGLRRFGLPVAAMAGDQANPAVNRVVRRLRKKAGVEPLSARSGLRDAVRILKAGGFVCTLMDQDARSKGIFVDFLGAPASTHVGVPALAARTGAPLVMGAMGGSGERYEFRLGPIVRFPQQGTEQELRLAAVVYNRWLEEEVR
ncbi:lysophospholipid acyltransferase family protein, partial [bacterium]|nr:lysophospholipid acyltransferase family protein [bacterium]